MDDVRRLAADLQVGLGWHYLLDIAWILRSVDIRPGMTVLDAGAGTGIMQWYLAETGVHVISVDRQDRSSLSTRFRLSYQVEGLHPTDLRGYGRSLLHDVRSGSLAARSRAHFRALRRSRRRPRSLAPGRVTIHQADLSDLGALESASIDHVIAVSALEHNDPERLPGVVSELYRVLRPGGALAATLGASAGTDWLHEPSHGWCYSEETLRTAFGLAPDCPSNYGEYQRIFEAVRDSAELRDNLASFYFRSGKNGMPWGKWDPRYLSVGVLHEKAT